uniref:WGS project CBMD000000000 data, contig CS3427_c000385 n=1 Tax=Fusarium pseudograminearum CS3427 TaxID=1318457 RepID=A0A096PBF5_FUSPS|nr:unnamed protein product [Fusarium pseudograminearum CS3427]
MDATRALITGGTGPPSIPNPPPLPLNGSLPPSLSQGVLSLSLSLGCRDKWKKQHLESLPSAHD